MWCFVDHCLYFCPISFGHLCCVSLIDLQILMTIPLLNIKVVVTLIFQGNKGFVKQRADDELHCLLAHLTQRVIHKRCFHGFALVVIHKILHFKLQLNQSWLEYSLAGPLKRFFILSEIH